MANSTTIITDLASVAANGPSTTTIANAIAATGITVSAGAAGNYTGGTGNYGSTGGPFYGGIMDYKGAVLQLSVMANDMARLLERVLANTDQATDSTNQTLLVKILNDLQ
jgi:hypothetical protein